MINEQIEQLDLKVGELVEIEVINIFLNERFVFSSYVLHMIKNEVADIVYYNPFRNKCFSLFDETQKISYVKRLYVKNQDEKTLYQKILETKLWQFLKRHWTNMVNSMRK